LPIILLNMLTIFQGFSLSVYKSISFLRLIILILSEKQSFIWCFFGFLLWLRFFIEKLCFEYCRNHYAFKYIYFFLESIQFMLWINYLVLSLTRRLLELGRELYFRHTIASYHQLTKIIHVCNNLWSGVDLGLMVL
jgi:hypothetical protein